MNDPSQEIPFEGLLLVNKPVGKTSFSLVASLRKRINVKKIGHAGTLDPFASGLVILLIGKNYTKQADRFLGQDKEYLAELRLGATTDTYDLDGQVILTSDKVPSKKEIEEVIQQFQGDIEQIPPMYSAKKINGQKLYHLARKGKTVERTPVKIKVSIDCLEYAYPFLKMKVSCSKGTYIRSLAHDIGVKLGTGAHLTALQRIRSGDFYLHQCLEGFELESSSFDRNRCSEFLISYTSYG
jgi:tRNA pseudouridine55 synthase